MAAAAVHPGANGDNSCGQVATGKPVEALPQPVGAPQPATAPTAPSFEETVRNDPRFHKEAQVACRKQYGLDDPDVAAFLSNTEFVSLGGWCGVAMGLMALGMRNCAYPFDWVRSPLDGIAHCLNTDFQDFLTFATCKTVDVHTVYAHSRWGGSFWHQDPLAMKTYEEMTRRVERLLGLANVPLAKPRCFVRAVNSSGELMGAVKLLETIQQTLPGTKVYLLCIIDLQSTAEPMVINGLGQNVRDHLLFYRVTKNCWEAPHDAMKPALVYVEAIAYAAKLWSGQAQPALEASGQRPGALEVVASCEPFDGGSPASESFFPKQIYGRNMMINRPRPVALPVPATPQVDASSASALPREVSRQQTAAKPQLPGAVLQQQPQQQQQQQQQQPPVMTGDTPARGSSTPSSLAYHGDAVQKVSQPPPQAAGSASAAQPAGATLQRQRQFLNLHTPYAAHSASVNRPPVAQASPVPAHLSMPPPSAHQATSHPTQRSNLPMASHGGAVVRSSSAVRRQLPPSPSSSSSSDGRMELPAAPRPHHLAAPLATAPALCVY
eukprot:TRINITY_DN5007_c0_g1_i2.p1 TRINITY_DN5007_c0_g1~~TRINITY_DN5007_c0_g1_i2.p1  ORF type:complete len:551 (+),score=95.02 TRINITY_DN5007_c0_g1_i2:72-1724(+)